MEDSFIKAIEIIHEVTKESELEPTKTEFTDDLSIRLFWSENGKCAEIEILPNGDLFVSILFISGEPETYKATNIYLPSFRDDIRREIEKIQEFIG